MSTVTTTVHPWRQGEYPASGPDPRPTMVRTRKSSQNWTANCQGHSVVSSTVHTYARPAQYRHLKLKNVSRTVTIQERLFVISRSTMVVQSTYTGGQDYALDTLIWHLPLDTIINPNKQWVTFNLTVSTMGLNFQPISITFTKTLTNDTCASLHRLILS